jgi:hypothetical protein
LHASDGRVQNRTGLLIVRVWLEGDSGSDALRARITQTVDLLEGAAVVTAAATTDDVYATVRDWLEAYLAS